MLKEKKSRKIEGASALENPLDPILEKTERMNSQSYNSCPPHFKKLLKNAKLDELLYWKLQDQLETDQEKETLKNIIAEVERPLFALVLNKTNGNQSKAAHLLGCNRNTLHRKLKEFFINPKEMKKNRKPKSSPDKPIHAFSKPSFTEI